MIVTYFVTDGDTYRPVYVADVDSQERVVSGRFTIGEAVPVTPIQRRMMQARVVAMEQNAEPCTPVAMNTVVVPPDDAAAPIEVYVMSAQAKAGEYPLGGHYLFTVDAEGVATKRREFTKSCIVLDSQKFDQLQGLLVSHLLDPVPTEIHVFTSLSAGVPVFVLTSENDRLWQVRGDAISEIEDPLGKGKSR